MPEVATLSRREQIVDAARRILEEQGEDALTVRRLAEALGIRAPSLYKHFPDKAAVEVALMQIGLQEAGAAAPLMLVLGGDLDRARALWGMAHGLVLLELDGRLPADADIDAAWRVGVQAFGTARPRSASRKETTA